MPEFQIELPTLTPPQMEAYEIFRLGNRIAISRPRCWGKTTLGKVIACDALAKGNSIAWIDTYPSRIYGDFEAVLAPIERGAWGPIRTITGGSLDLWGVDDEFVCRGRRYDGVIIDNASWAGDLTNVWRRNIIPSLLGLNGWAMVLLDDSVQIDYEYLSDFGLRLAA